MDEHFEHFLKKMGPAIENRAVPQPILDTYQGQLPDQLLAYWKVYGWCGYADGLFWTVNPQEYEPVLEAWIGETPFMDEDAYHIIARSAFGDLYFFGAEHGRLLHIIALDATMIGRGKTASDLDLSIRAFFGSRSRNGCDFSDLSGNGLFVDALNKLGPLKHDEMYGFEPALALGGSPTLRNLRKIRAVEHLVLLAQFAPLSVVDF